MTPRFRTQVTSLFTAIAFLPGAATHAQGYAVLSSAQSAAEVPGSDRLTPSELEDLLGPIALYPDPLLANVLAAAVYPTEVAEAAAFIAGGGQAAQVDGKSWEDPVKAVAKIPDAIKMMGQYKEWTVALGQAYLVQAKDVMDVVQSLRKKAQDNGALQTTPQQNVVVDQQVIYIKPADPEIIYVPVYTPATVYVQPYNNNAAVAGVVGFGLGVTAGLIMANNMDCNWHGGYVGYGYHGGGNDVNINVNNTNNVVAGNGNRSGNTVNAGNKIGNEGNAYAPNKSKSLASSQSNQLSQFKGGSASANSTAVPGGRASAANTANRTGAAAGQTGARPNAQSSGTGSGGLKSASPSAPPARSTPSASPTRQQTPSQPSSSAFSGGSNTRSESQRGASSRSQPSGGGSRSSSGGGGGGGGGGGSRGGGGGGGGRR